MPEWPSKTAVSTSGVAKRASGLIWTGFPSALTLQALSQCSRTVLSASC